MEKLAIVILLMVVVGSIFLGCVERLNEKLVKVEKAKAGREEKAANLADSIVQREALRAEEQQESSARPVAPANAQLSRKPSAAPDAVDLEIPADFILSEFRQT